MADPWTHPPAPWNPPGARRSGTATTPGRTWAMALCFSLLAACRSQPTPEQSAGMDCRWQTIPHAALLDHLLHRRLDNCELEALSHFAQERATVYGPYKQEVRLATSADGLTFTPLEGTVMSRAGVPELVREPDGHTFLYYVDGDLDRLSEIAQSDPKWFALHGVPGLGALRLAVSRDGRHFKPEPDFAIDRLIPGMVVDPDVVQQPDGTWRMYYVGMPFLEYFEKSDWSEDEQHEVFWASSDDLVHWVQQGRAVRGPFADPSVYCTAERDCLMLSFGLDRSLSSDGGRTFRYLGKMGPRGFAPEFLSLSDGSVRLFYSDKEVGAPLRSMRSENGTDWKAEEGERMPGAYGEAVSVVVQPDASFLMAYHTYSDPADAPFVVEEGEDGEGTMRPLTPPGL